jgi:hypothetical protein
MNRSKLTYLSVFLFAIFSGITILYYLNQTVFAEPSLKPSKNPCWFKGYDDPSITWNEIEARQNREVFGYSADVPIETAVKKFNEEMRCYPQFSDFPELTEDEVIASLIDFDSLNQQPNYVEMRREERKNIISEKILPKGSLLRFSSGICSDTGGLINNDLCAKGLKITLTFNLDKDSDEKKPSANEDIFVIRKTFVKFQPRN